MCLNVFNSTFPTFSCTHSADNWQLFLLISEARSRADVGSRAEDGTIIEDQVSAAASLHTSVEALRHIMWSRYN